MAQKPGVPETMAGNTLLLTGASGFMGKALLEKLLRACPGITRVYVILRARRGKEPRDRLREILQEPLFEKLKQERPEILLKVEALNGDCAEMHLGLSETDRIRVQAEVNLIIHAAASVRFDDPLQKAVLLNTRGARELTKLACGMPKLKALIHVSTTYSNTHQPEIEERVYPATADWREVVELAETMDEESMEKIAPKYMGYHPNTYTFSKSLAEQVMNDNRDKINIAIFRPSIVVGAFKEPIPGWVDNLNGPLALCVGVSKGLLHTAMANENSVLDFVPVDVAINGIVLTAYDALINGQQGEIKVFNGCASNKKTLNVKEIMEAGLKSIEVAPHDKILWYPFLIVTKRKWLFILLSVIFHFIPGFIIDSLLRITGNKPWMVRTYSKAFRATLALQYFTTRHWVFRNEKFFTLERNLNKRDAVLFKLDVSKDIDVMRYMHDTMQGLRKYVLKEDLDPVKAKRNQMTMYLIDRALRVVALYFLGKFLVGCLIG